MAYIYQITNDINGKIYVGKTEFSIEKRWKEHCQDSRKINNQKRPLYAAMQKYGVEHFHIELIEETNNPEERERFWIEQKQSFKNGYNATMGGDGKKYLDYDLIIATYNQLQNIAETANKLEISKDSIHNILTSYKISIKSSQEVLKEKTSIPVHMYDLNNNYLQSFSSSHEAARYMIANGLTKCKHSTIRQHISEVCRKKRKTAAGYKWYY